MMDLLDFQPCNDGEITLCEIDGRIHTKIDNYEVNNYTSTVEKHPKIHITRDVLHPTKTIDEGRDLFLPVHVSYLKQLTQIYCEHGLFEVLKHMSRDQNFVVSFPARCVLKTMEKLHNIKTMFDPSLREPQKIVINRLSQTRNWIQSPVRCIAWHPILMKIAVAGSDDAVRIYKGDSTGNVVPILKFKQQKNITCMAWRPTSNSDIAIGCESCIIVWNVDPNSVMTRPSMNHAIILYRYEHQPVLSICWSPRGDILATCAAHDSKILLWDVEMDRTSSLKRPGARGHCLLKWSSKDDKLFASTTTHIFRVWDTNTWQVERWSVAMGYVKAACWSPNGKYLIFSTSEEPMLYYVSFATPEVIFATDTHTSSNLATPLYDVSKVDNDGVTVGGIVQCIEWDPRGSTIAVMFQDTKYIATFSVVLQQTLQLSPGCLISGNPEEVPYGIAFQPKFEHGACLTINWSSGRVQHFPIVYTDISNTTAPQMPTNDFNSFVLCSPRSPFRYD